MRACNQNAFACISQVYTVSFATYIRNLHVKSLIFFIMNYNNTFFPLQLTWIPNEIEGYDVAVFEFIDRLSEPRGWLLKLWEAGVSGGVVIFLTNTDSKWDKTKVGDVIRKRCVFYHT